MSRPNTAKSMVRAGFSVLVLTIALAAYAYQHHHRRVVAARGVTASAPFPGAHWEHADPESAGFSPDGLRAIRALLPKTTTGFMLVAHGRVIFEAGDVQELSYIASVRKSVLAMLFGKYVAGGQIRLDETLASLGLDEVGGLTPAEKEATIADLLSSRSGVFHVSNAGGDLHEAPPRGSQEHGTYFLYNNFDFNALGAIFERRAGRDIYDALRDDLAVPVGMEDFRREAQKKDEAPEKSLYPAYHMTLSTRDMARLGYLMLREGDWAGQQLIPRDWVQKVTTITTPLEKLHPASEGGKRLGYGLLWWVFDDAPARGGGDLQGAYTAWGAFGQYLTVIPKLDLVIANKSVPPPDKRDRSSIRDYLRLVDLIVAHGNGAQLSEPIPEPIREPRREIVLAHRSPSEEGNLKSGSGPQTTIRFENLSAEPLALYWLDRSGQRKSYGEIPPGTNLEMRTFATHAWLLTDHLGKAATVVVAEPDDCVAIITDADLAGR